MTKILFSPGYGAGWSTWSDDDLPGVQEFLLKDPTLVEMAERNAPEKEVKAYIDSKFPDAHIYTGGWRDIEVVDIPAGTQFIVTEYDGHESIQTNTETKWITA